MKPFNLERALAGDPVVTRNGRDALRPVHDPDASQESYRLSFMIKFESGLKRFFFCEDGKWKTEGDSHLDLFMAPVKKNYYLNWYKTNNCVHTGRVYDTEGEAHKNIGPISEYIGTFPTEIEL